MGYDSYMASSIKTDHGSTSWLLGLIVAASLVAVETDVGETISAAKVAFAYGLWSVRVFALLSAGPSSYFCIHQLLFPCLGVLVQGASPHNAVGCKVLPGLGVDVKCFHVSVIDILVAQLCVCGGGGGGRGGEVGGGDRGFDYR